MAQSNSPAGPLFTHHCPRPPYASVVVPMRHLASTATPPGSPAPAPLSSHKSAAIKRQRKAAAPLGDATNLLLPETPTPSKPTRTGLRPLPTPPRPAPPPHRSRPCPSLRQPRARSPLLQLLERRVALLLEKPHGTTPGKTLWLRILGPFLLQLLVMELKRNGPLQAHPSYQKTL